MAQPRLQLTSLVSNDNPTLRRLLAFADVHRPKGYKLVADAREADIILFVESGYLGFRSITDFIAASRRNGEAEYFVFSESDWPFPYVPGLYPSLASTRPWAYSWSYLLNETDVTRDTTGKRRYLFSFIGRISTNPVRRRVQQLDSRNTPCLDLSSGPQRFADWDYQRTFAHLLDGSHFILCPRGIGASSMRIFEAMRAGRVPVIIGDSWIEPPVGDWSAFSLRIPEHAVERIPDICTDYLDRAASMGDLARATFQRYFAPPVFLDRALDFIRLNEERPGIALRTVISRAIRTLSVREIRTMAYHAKSALLRTASSLSR